MRALLTSPVREYRTPGSARGPSGNRRSYLNGLKHMKVRHLSTRLSALALFMGLAVFTNFAQAAKTVPLTSDQLRSLLAERLNGSMGLTFAQFANMFLVKSHLSLSKGIALSTPDNTVADAGLMPVFPETYKPTFREFLDAIALQTHTEWRYVVESQTLQSNSNNPVEGVACFEFTPGANRLNFSIKVPTGWAIRDGGNRLMCSPPTFPVGIDFYEVGTYSLGTSIPTTMERIVDDVALEWAKRANAKATMSDMAPARVGKFNARYFQARVASRMGGELNWKQWVFSVGNRCYFVISTLDDNNSRSLSSAIDGILQSFEIKDSPNQSLLPTPANGTPAAASSVEAAGAKGAPVAPSSKAAGR